MKVQQLSTIVQSLKFIRLDNQNLPDSVTFMITVNMKMSQMMIMPNSEIIMT